MNNEQIKALSFRGTSAHTGDVGIRFCICLRIGTKQFGYTFPEVERMLKFVIGGACAALAFVMYCCCRVASEEDRRMEALYRQETERLRKKRDAS